MKLNRREFVKYVGINAGLLTLAGCKKKAAAKSKKKPNIIYIMADDMGYSGLGCYGQTKILTPNIDKMAAQGMKFTDFYTSCPVCAPARFSLVTGKHGGHAYVRDNYEIGEWESYQGQLPIPQGTVTIGSILKKQGYANGCFGKWGIGAVNTSGDPLNNGFDRFYGYNCQRHAHNYYPRYLVSDKENVPLEGNDRGTTGKHYAPQLIADQLLDFIRDNKDKPFFVYYASVLPHLGLQVPQEYIDQYLGKWPETPYTGKSYVPHPTPKACLAAMHTFLDAQVGRIIELLKELGIENNTIVMFSSDNGPSPITDQTFPEFFEPAKPFRGKKRDVYEGGVRVPMVAYWPGKIKPGTVTDHISAQYDLLATVANLANAEVPKDTDGISFVPTLMSQPEKQKQHKYLFWDFAGAGAKIGVRMGKFKGIKKDLKKNPDAPLELYNLEDDIAESKNVSADYPEIAVKIEKIMLEARTKPEIKEFQFGKYKQ